MMIILDYTFYRFYRYFYRRYQGSYDPEISALFLLAALLAANVQGLAFVIAKFHGINLGNKLAEILVLAIVTYVPVCLFGYIRWCRRKKLAALVKLYEGESNRKQKVHTRMLAAYIALTFALPIAIAIVY